MRRFFLVFALLSLSACWTDLDGESDSSEDAIVRQGASAKRVAAGYEHTCAIVAEGAVKCWGDNSKGQLGDGTTVSSIHPVDVLVAPNGPPLKGATAIYAGWFDTCAILDAGKAVCWGDNAERQMGYADTSAQMRLSPYPLSGSWDSATQRSLPVSGVKSLAINERETCGIFMDNSVRCWDQGLPSAPGANQAGFESTTGTAVAIGSDHGCARTVDGNVVCWGENDDLQLGVSGLQRGIGQVTTAQGGVVEGVTDIAVGRAHTCALLAGGRIRCWGANVSGQLGDGMSLRSNMDEVLVAPGGAPITGATAIFASGERSCALFKHNKLLCWGSFNLGSSTPITSPTNVIDTSLTGLSALTMGDGHTCAVTRGGVVQCWGVNSAGQLGSATPLGEDASSETRIPRPVTFADGKPLVVP